MPKRILPLISLLLLLSACAGNVRQNEPARYDLGALPGNGEVMALPLSRIEVDARPWLISNAMQYRLAYVDGSRRYSFADSQWVAPPAELIERYLTRRLAFPAGDAAAGQGCRLQLGIDEIVQVFSSETASSMTLEARATLLPARNSAAIARRAFQIQMAAPTADAGGGVQATRDAVQKLGTALNGWLQELQAANPAAMQERCKGV